MNEDISRTSLVQALSLHSAVPQSITDLALNSANVVLYSNPKLIHLDNMEEEHPAGIQAMR